MKDIVYIATDRTSAKHLKIYGGYNYYPNIERMANKGTIYKNAISCAASTIMSHTSEWLGDYTWAHHKDIPFSKRLYEAEYGHGESIFTDFIKMGYDVHLIFVSRINQKTGNKKYYYTYKDVANLWPKEAYIHVIPDHDMPEQSNKKFNRENHILSILDCINQSKKRNRPAFVWIKMHGFYNGRQTQYINYAGQYRPSFDCTFNAEIDDAIGKLLDEVNFEKSTDCPEIWFASDHGSFNGENYRRAYGYHLYEDIVHVPLICSNRIYDQLSVSSVFSMKEIRRILTRDNSIGLQGHNFDEKYIYSETLFPGQVPKKGAGQRASMAKIMVRNKNYKYIYSVHGPDGLSDLPTEELFDLDMDPQEKFNLTDVFSRKFVDAARPDTNSDNGLALFTRYARNNKYGNGMYDGWKEIYEIIHELRNKAENIWTSTGRGKYFNPHKIKKP